jgi:hypothetical protein
LIREINKAKYQKKERSKKRLAEIKETWRNERCPINPQGTRFLGCDKLYQDPLDAWIKRGSYELW